MHAIAETEIKFDFSKHFSGEVCTPSTSSSGASVHSQDMSIIESRMEQRSYDMPSDEPPHKRHRPLTPAFEYPQSYPMMMTPQSEVHIIFINRLVFAKINIERNATSRFKGRLLTPFCCFLPFHAFIRHFALLQWT